MPNPDTKEFDVQDPKNKQISPDEIKQIEEITNKLKTPEGEEQTLKKISKVDDDFLKNIKQQADLILNDINDNTENVSPDQLKAMLSLLAMYELRNPWSIVNAATKDISINWSIDDLLAIVGTKPENFQSILGNWTKVLRKIVDKRIAEWRTEFDKKRQAEEDVFKEEGKVKEEMESETWLTPEHARMYIKNLLTDEEINKGTVNDRFVKIRERFRENDVFKNAVDVLMNFCKKYAENPNYPKLAPFIKLTKDPIDLNNMKSDKVKEFQKLALECKDDEIISIINNDMNWKEAVDGKLWYNTLNAIVKITEVIEKKYSPGAERGINESNERVAEDWYPIDRMPTTIWWLNNLWEIWDDKKFQFDKKYIEKLDAEWKKLAVNIEWKKYLLNPENSSDLWFRQTEKKYVTHDADWNEIVKIWQELSFWKFDGDNRFEWTTISIGPDWKQIQSTYFDETRTRYEWKSPKKEVKWQMAVYRLWNNIDDEWNFRWKWRIDLFTDDDAKRLNKDQLYSLDAQDITFVIDQAMAAYDETKHKPSEVWRYNLNRIVYSTMKRTGAFDDLNAPFDTPKTVSHIILWMDTWFFSNPEKKIKESDINDINDEKLMKMLKINKDDVKDYKELKYDWKETTKWDQIINRLKILKAFVEKNKKKLDNKKD